MDTQGRGNTQAAMIGWSIKNLLENDKLLQPAQSEWKWTGGDQQHLDLLCTKQELDKEVEWFEKKLTELLNNRAKITQITSYSKRWWNKEVAEVISTWAKDKRRLGGNEDLKEEFKKARNRYFRTIKKAKRDCWQKFLEEEFQSSSAAMDNNHCWAALKYSKPLQFRRTPALKDSDGNTAVSLKAKEVLVRRSAFLKPPTNLVVPSVTSFGSAYIKIIKEGVAQALVTQAITKAPGLDKINFQIFQMIWGWDKARITSMVYHAI